MIGRRFPLSMSALAVPIYVFFVFYVVTLFPISLLRLLRIFAANTLVRILVLFVVAVLVVTTARPAEVCPCGSRSGPRSAAVRSDCLPGLCRRSISRDRRRSDPV